MTQAPMIQKEVEKNLKRAQRGYMKTSYRFNSFHFNIQDDDKM